MIVVFVFFGVLTGFVAGLATLIATGSFVEALIAYSGIGCMGVILAMGVHIIASHLRQTVEETAGFARAFEAE